MNDLLSTIARVRRGTMNHDVITICDELERRLLVRTTPVTDPRVFPTDGRDNPTTVTRPRFDRGAYQRDYMRDYMRNYRQRKKANRQ